LIVVAIGLVSPSAIKMTMHGPWSDRIAFLITLIATWLIPLDKAIYLGVGISLMLYLRQARLLHIRELAVDTNNKLVERNTNAEFPQSVCQHIRILHVEGHLFFGVVGELQDALDKLVLDYNTRVIILRIKRTRGMDVTVGAVLTKIAERLSFQDRHLLLAGVRDEAMEVFENTEMDDQFEEGAIFRSKARWFASMEAAVEHAAELAFRETSCEECPIRRYLDQLEQERDDDFVRFEDSDARLAAGE
jgi:SulP family sulfate permease